MSSCYIGVGGIGCRLLKQYEQSLGAAEDKFIYMDSAPEALQALDSGEHYVLTGQRDGCTMRIIGKDEIKALIYSDLMPNPVDGFFLNEELEVVFVTTAFGGFGSAVVYELSDYYSVKIKKYRQTNGVKNDFKCRVIAFPLSSVGLKGAPRNLMEFYATNEVEFVNEFRVKESRNNNWYQERSNCIPFVELFVPMNVGCGELYKTIGFSAEKLNEIDCKKKYYFTPAPAKAEAEVFISYSSQNQDVADMIVKTAKENGVSCWIASESIEAGSYAKQIVQGIKAARVFVVILSESAILSPHVKNELNVATERIKEGLIIMPFKIDSSELDDECRYYLGRQEFFFAEKPPIEERIAQFVLNIKKVLNL